jgi:hypothetical protein
MDAAGNELAAIPGTGDRIGAMHAVARYHGGISPKAIANTARRTSISLACCCGDGVEQFCAIGGELRSTSCRPRRAHQQGAPS